MLVKVQVIDSDGILQMEIVLHPKVRYVARYIIPIRDEKNQLLLHGFTFTPIYSHIENHEL